MLPVKRYLLLFFLCFGVSSLYSTHNRAGEITYQWISGNTYKITLVTYTDDGPNIADRCKLTIHFGDGDSAQVLRSNGAPDIGGDCGSAAMLGQVLKPKFKKNVYVTTHTYAGPGSYKIYMFDRNRNQGVWNVPNSVNQPFYLETFLSIGSFTGPNNSPVLTVMPLDQACLHKCYYHNPGAYDPDGDSLSYELVSCKGEDPMSSQIGVAIPGYSFPDPGAGGTYTINAITGTLTWCEPQNNGEYNAAFVIKEWRKKSNGEYKLVGSVMRDMQIIVDGCSNIAPVISPVNDTCVMAGTNISKLFTATDANTSDIITLTATGGPFAASAPAATFASAPGTGTVTGILQWQTACNHVRNLPYQVTIKAIDNDSQIQLVDFKTYNITVVGPPPLNLSATPLGTSIKLVWNKSACNNIGIGNKIIYYNVYRKNNCSPWVHGTCETGVPPSSGFTYIGHTNNINDTTYIDNNNGAGLAHGVNYSYLVTAFYADASSSYASNQVCAQLKKDVPILINVDVMATGTTTGQVFVRWIKPITNLSNLDTSVLPGPYEFRLSAKQGVGGTFSQIYSVTKPYFGALNQLSDTTYTHSGINTVIDLLIYKLDFYANSVFIGSAQTASSVFLSGVPADRKVTLSWKHFVPWGNYKYYIFRKNPSQTTYSLIDSTVNLTYKDSGSLANRATYCYKVLSKGEYSDPSIYKPLLNNSQEICLTPIDLTPPCSPSLAITADCQTGFVQLKWNNPNHSCSDDIIKYYLYYKATEEEDLSLLDSIKVLSDTVYTFDGLESIAGCYLVTAIDSSGNESFKGEATCVDNCPEFELPNVVTFNGDDVNDFFKAIRVKYIKSIDLYVYNRWGQLMFETKDPYFKWDGKVLQTKQLCSDGTYFYVCTVYELRVKPIKPRVLKGTLQVFK